MSKSANCTIVICWKCKQVVQKNHTRTGEHYRQPWTFRQGHPICLKCIEKNNIIATANQCGKTDSITLHFQRLIDEKEKK